MGGDIETQAMAENPVISAYRRQRRRRAAQRGFTMIELLVALTVMLIGLSGVLSVQLVSSQASSYSRHAGEAAVLAEAKMEEMRTTSIANLVAGSDTVDAQGNAAANGIFTRSWTISWNSNVATVTLTVSWLEQGSETHSITYRTQRTQ